ncbi:MAG: hypothetical protein LBB80_01720 [Treponema sp.]|jgi:hypothetical protein|nr:hypothetical protein [Treponema sp.]
MPIVPVLFFYGLSLGVIGIEGDPLGEALWPGHTPRWYRRQDPGHGTPGHQLTYEAALGAAPPVAPRHN